MAKFFRLLMLFLCLGFFQTVYAEKIKPFNEWNIENPNWHKDSSEVAYVLVRCGVLFSTFGIYFIQNGTVQEDKKNGEGILAKGEQLNKGGTFLAMSTGMSVEAATSRYKKLFEIYVSDVKSNKQVNNNIFFGNTGNDFNFCTSVYADLNLGK